MGPRTDTAAEVWYPQSMWEALCQQSTEIGCMHQRAIALQNELGRQLKACQARLADAERRASIAEHERQQMMEQVRQLHRRLNDL